MVDSDTQLVSMSCYTMVGMSGSAYKLSMKIDQHSACVKNLMEISLSGYNEI